MATKHAPQADNQPMPGDDITLMSIMQRFPTAEDARAYLESVLWPDGPVCPHCGNTEQLLLHHIQANPAKKVRPGLWRCADCRQQFTVTVGTVMEDSHIPLHKWLVAFYIMCASKTQVSALQLQRQLELGSYRTALFLCHRIRFALSTEESTCQLSGTVEADETYMGGEVRGRGRGYVGNKTPVVSLVERGGSVRSHVTPAVSGAAIGDLLRQHIAETAVLNTDESPVYTRVGAEFAAHDMVNHGQKEYARFDELTGRLATTNTVEGFFGNAKRSLDGTHHRVSGKHLWLYFAELDYKYNTRKGTDGARTVGGIKRMRGKRLMLKTPRQAAEGE